MRTVLTVLITVFGMSVPVAQAGDIRIDLSNFQSTTAGNWNNVSDITGLTPNLIDFNTGLGTGVSIDGSGSPWQNFFGDETNAFPDQDWLIQPATEDGAGLFTDMTGAFELAGLTGSSYQIEIVSARNNFNYLNTFSVNGAGPDRTFLGTSVNTPWNSTTDGLTPGNWLIWDNVVPVGGTIDIVDVAGPGTLGILNAMRVLEIGATVPEPSTTLLVLGACLTGLATARRGRRMQP